jgi:hypothetical protein
MRVEFARLQKRTARRGTRLSNDEHIGLRGWLLLNQDTERSRVLDGWRLQELAAFWFVIVVSVA